MTKVKCVNCGKEFSVDCYEEDREFCSGECERTARWAYVVLRCDGTVDVVPCERGVDLGKAAEEVIACAGIDEFEPWFGLPYGGLPRQEWTDVVFLTNENDRTEYAADFRLRANRAVWGLAERVVYGDVVIVRKAPGRQFLAHDRDDRFAPIPVSVAERMAEVARACGTANEDWIPETYPPEGEDLRFYLKDVMVKKTCATCGKEFEVSHDSTGRKYFCSDECDDACGRMGYVVLRCDGTIEAVECARTARLEGDVWPEGTATLDAYCFGCGQHGPLYGVGDVRVKSCQVGFDATALAGRVNKVLWAFDNAVVFGDAILAGRYAYGGDRNWIPFAAAEKLAENLRTLLAKIKPRPVPETLLREALIGNDNPAFFERCYQRGLWGWGFPAFALFSDKDDKLLVEQLVERRDVDVIGEVDARVIADTEDGCLCAMGIGSKCLHEESPINEVYFGSFRGRKMNEAVRSGRVKFYVGFWLDNVDELAKFRQEEGDLEGKDWKVIFQDNRDAGDDEARVAIATSLPIKWLDRTPWNAIDASGGFAK